MKNNTEVRINYAKGKQMSENKRVEQTFFLAQKLFVTWEAYNLSDEFKIADPTGKIIIESALADLKILEYESLELGDKIETTEHVIGRVIELWRYHDHDNNDDECVITLSTGTKHVVTLNNYLRLVSKYNFGGQEE